MSTERPETEREAETREYVERIDTGFDPTKYLSVTDAQERALWCDVYARVFDFEIHRSGARAVPGKIHVVAYTDHVYQTAIREADDAVAFYRRRIIR